MIRFRSSIALGLWLAACASAPQSPARTSPLSPQAEEPPIAPVATSLRTDPLAAPLPAAPDGHAGHHHSSVSAPTAEVQAASETYVCPMHPDVKRSTPGKCPICGMKLVPAPKPGPAPDPHPHEHHAD
jgi:hypothetical protein